MIKKLSSRFLLGALAMCSSLGSFATPTTITSSYLITPAAFFNAFNISGVNFNVMTFMVENNNPFPIKISEVGMWHATSQNGATYTIWAAPMAANATLDLPTPNSNNNQPNVSLANGWTLVGTSDPVSPAANGIVKLVDNVGGFVPPNRMRRFAVVSDKAIWFGAGNNLLTVKPSPTIHTVNNVTLNTDITWYGINNTASVFTPGNVNTATPAPPANRYWAWNGYIVFDTSAPEPPVITSTKLSVCKGDCVTLTATGPSYVVGGEYTFYGPGVTGVIPQGSSDGPATRTICFPPYTSGPYTVTVKDPSTGMVSAPGTIKIGIIDPPAPSIEGKLDYCLNEAFDTVKVFLSQKPGDIKYFYTQTGGSPLPFTPYFNTTTAHEDDYWVAEQVSGCIGPRTQIHYRAAPKPNPPIVTTPIYQCENDLEKQLSANGEKPLKWFYQQTGGIPSLIAPTPNTTKQDSFAYWVTQTIDGCESDRSKIDVVVTFRPNGLILPSRYHICQDDTVTLNYYGSAFKGSAYNFEYPDDAIYTPSDTIPKVIKLFTPGRRTVKLHVGVDGCYSPTYSTDIEVDAKPTAVIETNDDICEGQRTIVSLSSYTLTTDTFNWDFGDGVVEHAAIDQGPYGVRFNSPGKKTITLTLVEGLCTNVIIDSPTVHPKPDATFAMSGKEPYCSDDSVLFTPNTISSFSSYTWTPARFFDNYSNIPVAFGHLDYQDTMSINLTVKDQYGCMNTVSKVTQTKPCCEIYFPTAFSPNGDGNNETFHPISAGYKEIRSLKIMNRWGQVVYESVNPGISKYDGWNGQMNGKDQDMGSYFYYINFKCAGKTMEQKGEFVLVR